MGCCELITNNASNELINIEAIPSIKEKKTYKSKQIKFNNSSKNTKKKISKSVNVQNNYNSGIFDKIELDENDLIIEEDDRNLMKKDDNESDKLSEFKPKEEKEKNKEIKEENVESKRIRQMVIGNKIKPQVDLETANKVSKSICKILIKNEEKPGVGTGFFFIYKNVKYLITCYHVVEPTVKKFEVELFDKNIFEFELNNRYIEYLEEPLDITIIALKNSDEFINFIDYLDYDLNYIKGYSQYKDVNILNLGYPKGLKLVAESGKIEQIEDFEFYHDINTNPGSSGSPIILFNTLKVIGIHKNEDNEKKLNVATFIDVIFKKLDEKEKDKSNDVNKISEENEVNVIDIEVLENFICSINYNPKGKKYKDLGYLIKIPILKKTKHITGLLTKYYINENVLFHTKKINIYNNHNLLESFIPEDRFIFSDEFLKATFIEIDTDKLHLNNIDIYERDAISEEIILINYSQESNHFEYSTGKFEKKWGIFFMYKQFVDIFYLNYNSSQTPSGLIIDNKLVGIHKHNNYDYEIATNINDINKAIELNYIAYKDDIQNYLEKKGIENILNENQIEQLKNIGIEVTNISNVFISRPSFGVSPIWFLRTKHAWYWTPKKPEKNVLNTSNWMIICPNSNIDSIGGEFSGFLPAPKNIEIIHYLENSKLMYL